MNQRIQDATGQKVINDIVTAAKQTQQIKNVQPIGGDSLNFYQSDSGMAYDWSGTLPVSLGNPTIGQKILLVEAAALNQAVLFADIIYELYVSSPSNRYTSQNYLSDLHSGGIGFRIFYVSWPPDINHTDRARFGIGISGDTTTTCFAKFYVVANDQVTITVTPEN